jgi:hypothetical protein
LLFVFVGRPLFAGGKKSLTMSIIVATYTQDGNCLTLQSIIRYTVTIYCKGVK